MLQQNSKNVKVPLSKRLNPITRNWELYIMIGVVLAYFAIYHYWPMYGVQIGFRKFSGVKGILGSEWRGLYYFERFINSAYFFQTVSNTFLLSVYQLSLSFPAQIILALMMNELRSKAFKKTVQTVTYAPHFISMVVMCSMVTLFLSPTTGIINKIIEAFGGKAIYFLGEPRYFKTIYVISGVWQATGWGSIIYMAALAGIDPQIHEAAIIDGASRLQRIWHVNIPGILPTAVILLIMSCGNIMSVGFEKVYLLMNDLNSEAAEIISTYTYKRGLIDQDYSLSTAVGLMNSVVNMILLVTVNTISRKVSENSLW